ncbi:hypothetical protein Q2T41_14730 [Maribacter confluentis]|uniref:Uncharacterized protein n=1 Tax=Maribacter confluentis TaxID=1656093 RepID=A0ABT8RU41_9FLAO|nr:hypothetical protein [Maribacter confluentis]MDO1513914.1 hypothetical protein [Maribacter confluentis]
MYTSLIDRTIYILWRDIVFTFPAGNITWLTDNIYISELSYAEYFID